MQNIIFASFVLLIWSVTFEKNYTVPWGGMGLKNGNYSKPERVPTHIMHLGHFANAGETERQLFFRNHKSSYSALKSKFEPPEPGMNMMTYEFEK